MTPEQVEEASNLLIDREDLADRLAEIRSAKRVRIELAKESDGDDSGRRYFSNGVEKDITAPVRKLLMGDIETEIATIDARLEALGVDLTPLRKAASEPATEATP